MASVFFVYIFIETYRIYLYISDKQITIVDGLLIIQFYFTY